MRRDLPALAVFALLIGGAHWIGEWLLAQGWRTRILAAPLLGSFQTFLSWRTLPMLIVAVAFAARLPRWSLTATWPRLLWGSAGAVVAWSLALAFNRGGWTEVGRPMALRGHYLLDVGRVGPPTEYLAQFVEHIDTYGTHVRAHPPGFLLVLWAMDRIGLDGAQWAGVLAIVGGASAIPAVLVCARELSDESWARRAAPFLVLAPAALYVASTADAFFAGVVAWGVAWTLLGTSRKGAARDALGIAGGLALAFVLLLSYGLALFGVPIAAVLLARRSWRLGTITSATILAVIAAVHVAGFSWLAGLAATRREYAESVAQERPYAAFLLINAAAFAIVVGPATLAGLSNLWTRTPRGFSALVAIGLSCAGLAAVSGLSKGEVERIWLPFAFFTLPAAAATTARRSRRATRSWLSAQAGVAIGVQCFVRTNW